MIATVVGQLLLGWLSADLLSGLFHWLEDRVLRSDMPVLGRWIVVPNRLHHTDQLAFTRTGLVLRNHVTWLLTAAVAGGWILAFGPSLILAATAIGGLVVNEVHVCAHQPGRGGRAIAILQQTGLVQSPPRHAGHHRSPSDRRYCILTDWLNPVLDGLGVWAALEAALGAIGLEPNRGTA